ncbi:MAG: exodeoxyribonuclease I [Desulfamplus sp.]|nr:exodeoxyribonuclease I [Desulfamplus sp.]
MTSFLFYDIETTGLNSAFDQVLTFAAIRTDLDLNEIERYEITMQMRPDIVPSPGAFITHRLMPEDWEEGICEYEGACIIHAIVNTPGTLSIGYNSLGFDDEFLRFTFYRNMLDPYSHQYANGCCRMDLLPIATLYRIFKPEIIKWPEINDTKSSQKLPSLKLELISKINKFKTSGKAHNALVDVEATVALARCLIKENRMWRYSLDFFDKNKDIARIDSISTFFEPSRTLETTQNSFFEPSCTLETTQNSFFEPSRTLETTQNSFFQPHGENYKLALIVSHRLGTDSMYIAPVLGIGKSYHYSNQSIWLRLDKDIIPTSGLANPEKLFVIRKKYGETGLILPPLDRFWNRLSEEQKTAVEKNRSLIYDNPENYLLFKKIIEQHREFKYPFVPEADLDSLLYQSPFFTKAEKQAMLQFHKGCLKEKIAFIEEMKPSRIKALGIRILFRNYHSKESLSPLICNEYNRYMERVRCDNKDAHKKIIDFKQQDRLVPQKAIEEK